MEEEEKPILARRSDPRDEAAKGLAFSTGAEDVDAAGGLTLAGVTARFMRRALARST